MRVLLLSSVLVAALPFHAAVAGGLVVTGGASLSFATRDDTGTANAAYGYVEGELSNFYLGAAINLYKDSASNEVDLDIGYRNTLANGLGYDLSYTRYIYPSDGGDCCGDVALSVSMPLNDALTGTAALDYYPEDKTTEAHLSLDYVLNDKITLTGKVGRVGNIGAADTKEWELAATYALGAETAVVAHYYDGSDYKGYIGLDLTWDTTLLGG